MEKLSHHAAKMKNEREFIQYGCAITKALAKQTLNAVSFACSSRAAAKHTAKNANFKKTRASYYSGATADAELPFRISAKRAFHNGRPINGD
jgi:hypothetical protein